MDRSQIMCNGQIDCEDASDELYCIQCCDGSRIQMENRCDGKFDCPDGSDEMYCQNLSNLNVSMLIFGGIMSCIFRLWS